MMRLAFALLAFSTGGLTQAQERHAPSSQAPVTPFRDFRQQATPYAGPGREGSNETEVAEVLLGYFGPSDPNHPEGGDLWTAAELAVSQANSQGGYKGKPFRLVPSWSDDPWKAGVAGIARMVYRDHVWAIVGGIDGPTAHLAEQVAVKARVPLVCPTSSDRTANMANVSWMFSVLPGDHLQAPVLAAALLSRSEQKGYAFISAQDHDDRHFLDELERSLKQRRSIARFTHILGSTNSEMEGIVRQVVAEDVSAVVVAASAVDSARISRALRAAGFSGCILGTSAMGRRAFVAAAGPAAEGVLFPLVSDLGATSVSFRLEFEKRCHAPPDYAAAQSYDALNLLIAAVRRAGLNRAKIGDALRELAPYPGVAGRIEWDKLGSNTRPVVLGTIRDGHPISEQVGRPQTSATVP